MSTARLERRARSLSGVPRTVDPSVPLWKRILTSPWLWCTLAVLALGAYGLWDMYWLEHPDREVPGGTVPGITNESFIKAAKSAYPTALFWIVLFCWFDRFRKNRVLTWVMAFVWGACVSTWVSLYLNTWVGSLLNVRGNGDPAAASRPAVYAAPFVEEAAKATILFLIAIFLRYRLVSLMQTVTLAGLSAAGFAFVENILYYSRAWEFATRTEGAGDPEAAYHQLVMLRGVYTCFGHPFFTTMTGIGLVVGLRHRSKIVRILAPLTGFTLAACGHMIFNGTASIMSAGEEKKYWYMALAAVAMLTGFLVVRLLREQGMIRARLADLVSFGWLYPDDPKTYSSLWRRFVVLLFAASQPSRFIPTLRMMNAMTELAYLRDSMVRGLVDEIGYERARELLNLTRALRVQAVSTVEGERFVWPPVGRWLRSLTPRRQPAFAGANFPPPGANFPPPEQQWGPPPSR